MPDYYYIYLPKFIQGPVPMVTIVTFEQKIGVSAQCHGLEFLIIVSVNCKTEKNQSVFYKISFKSITNMRSFVRTINSSSFRYASMHMGSTPSGRGRSCSSSHVYRVVVSLLSICLALTRSPGTFPSCKN